VARRERQQRDVASLLDRPCQPPLVRRANAGQTPGNDLAPLGDKPLQQPNVAVRDRIDLFCAELAHLLAAKELAAAARAAGRTRAGGTSAAPPTVCAGARAGWAGRCAALRGSHLNFVSHSVFLFLLRVARNPRVAGSHPAPPALLAKPGRPRTIFTRLQAPLPLPPRAAPQARAQSAVPARRVPAPTACGHAATSPWRSASLPRPSAP